MSVTIPSIAALTGIQRRASPDFFTTPRRSRRGGWPESARRRAAGACVGTGVDWTVAGFDATSAGRGTAAGAGRTGSATAGGIGAVAAAVPAVDLAQSSQTHAPSGVLVSLPPTASWSSPHDSQNRGRSAAPSARLASVRCGGVFASSAIRPRFAWRSERFRPAARTLPDVRSTRSYAGSGCDLDARFVLMAIPSPRARRRSFLMSGSGCVFSMDHPGGAEVSGHSIVMVVPLQGRHVHRDSGFLAITTELHIRPRCLRRGRSARPIGQDDDLDATPVDERLECLGDVVERVAMRDQPRDIYRAPTDGRDRAVEVADPHPA